MIARRIAIVLAACGMVLCIAGTANAARVFISNAGHLTRLFLWALLPLGLAAVVCVEVVRGGSLWTVWVPVGTLWGFVVAAAWSLGLFYAYGGLFLLLAAFAHLVALRAWRKSLLVWLWFTAGVTALGPMFLAIGWILELTTPGLTVGTAPAVVFGSWVFLGTIALLGLWEICRRLPSRP
jgi:hypothetical protein